MHIRKSPRLKDNTNIKKGGFNNSFIYVEDVIYFRTIGLISQRLQMYIYGSHILIFLICKQF